jgi:hypothetical protein
VAQELRADQNLVPVEAAERERERDQQAQRENRKGQNTCTEEGDS